MASPSEIVHTTVTMPTPQIPSQLHTPDEALLQVTSTVPICTPHKAKETPANTNEAPAYASTLFSTQRGDQRAARAFLHVITPHDLRASSSCSPRVPCHNLPIIMEQPPTHIQHTPTSIPADENVPHVTRDMVPNTMLATAGHNAKPSRNLPRWDCGSRRPDHLYATTTTAHIRPAAHELAPTPRTLTRAPRYQLRLWAYSTVVEVLPAAPVLVESLAQRRATNERGLVAGHTAAASELGALVQFRSQCCLSTLGGAEPESLAQPHAQLP